MILQTSGASRRGIAELYLDGAIIACDKREAFAQGSEATKQSSLAIPLHGLLRGACHRAALCADPLARNDDPST
jgi:hypothetical protein